MIYSWKKIVLTSIPLLTITAIIEIIAGQILQGNIETLYMLPIFLISIPVVNSVGGNIGSILGARLASGLHVGTISYSIKDKTMHINLLTSVLMGIITYTALAILIYFISYFGGVNMGTGLPAFMGIIIGTGVALVVVISFISILTAFLAYKRGLDPDDMVAPVVTTFGDTLGIIILFLMIGAIGA
ncbi:MAG: magnesium transporter [Candidatus Thermoplasmatota archaeon]|nr:magnesium transporter [Candidatus Thermoplasmatota archaeon]MBU1940184.1 magnesium transporter [Candidatus Thermoplasmatota archaeon]